MSFSLDDSHDSLETFLRSHSPNEPEFHQAVVEVMEDVKPIIDQSEVYKSANVFKRLVEPERMISFQVAWQTDAGDVEVNRGYRVQFNGAIGPYKGGLRFHPSVNPSVLKFLAFEQTFKNALTGLPMGGAKGGSDFDPKGRSEAEIMRFCMAFMQELQRHIGPNIDIPAGDINVGAREIGYLFGSYRRIKGKFEGVLTGKEQSFAGSAMRTEATGYGVMYFLSEMLKAHDQTVEGKTVLISGAGNVATYAAEKAIDLGAKVITLSDSSGFIHDPDGMTQEKIDWVRAHKAQSGASLKSYTDEFGGSWTEGETPWSVKADVAVPCATQNELHKSDAEKLVENGITAVIEGANMPTTTDAKAVFSKGGILFAPGKAANAGGVAVSGLEISQNRIRRSKTADQVESELEGIMSDIHEACREEGRRDGKIDYAKGANIAGFRKVADAMVSQGIG